MSDTDDTQGCDYARFREAYYFARGSEGPEAIRERLHTLLREPSPFREAAHAMLCALQAELGCEVYIDLLVGEDGIPQGLTVEAEGVPDLAMPFDDCDGMTTS